MIASNEVGAYMILECLEENLFEPNRQWPNDIFEERSYARWAAFELAERLMDRPHEFPDLIIEEFILECALLKTETNSPRKKAIFSVAIDTAKDILTLF